MNNEMIGQFDGLPISHSITIIIKLTSNLMMGGTQRMTGGSPDRWTTDIENNTLDASTSACKLKCEFE